MYFIHLEQYSYGDYFTCWTVCKNGCVVARNDSFYQAFGRGLIYFLLIQSKKHKFMVRHNSCPNNLYLIVFPVIFSLCFTNFLGFGTICEPFEFRHIIKMSRKAQRFIEFSKGRQDAGGLLKINDLKFDYFLRF